MFKQFRCTLLLRIFKWLQSRLLPTLKLLLPIVQNVDCPLVNVWLVLKFWPNIVLIKACYQALGQVCKFILRDIKFYRIGPWYHELAESDLQAAGFWRFEKLSALLNCKNACKPLSFQLKWVTCLFNIIKIHPKWDSNIQKSH